MLTLILSYRNMGRPEVVVRCLLTCRLGCSLINEHVRRLEDWVSEQASIKQ